MDSILLKMRLRIKHLVSSCMPCQIHSWMSIHITTPRNWDVIFWIKGLLSLSCTNMVPILLVLSAPPRHKLYTSPHVSWPLCPYPRHLHQIDELREAKCMWGPTMEMKGCPWMSLTSLHTCDMQGILSYKLHQSPLACDQDNLWLRVSFRVDCSPTRFQILLSSRCSHVNKHKPPTNHILMAY